MSSSRNIEREPCPWRIVDDAGGAFLFGLVGGSIWHTFGGFRNAPTTSQMIPQAIQRVKVRGPILAGGFALWGTIFSMCDCSFTYIRNKEDPWNAIMSGAVTGGILAARAGLKAAGKNALAGGVILAAIEGFNIALSRVIFPYMENQQLQQGIKIDLLEPPTDPLRASYARTPLYQPSINAIEDSKPSKINETGFEANAFPTLEDDWEKKQKEGKVEKKNGWW